MFTRWICAGLLMIIGVSAHAAGGGGEEGEKSVHYQTIEPPFIVNITDGSLIRYLQVSVNVMAKTSALVEQVNFHQAPIRHELLMLLSDTKAEDVTNRKRREAIRGEALEVVRSTLGKYAHISEEKLNDELQDVLFTDFVIQ